MSCCNITLYCCLKKMMSTPALFFFFFFDLLGKKKLKIKIISTQLPLPGKHAATLWRITPYSLFPLFDDVVKIFESSPGARCYPGFRFRGAEDQCSYTQGSPEKNFQIINTSFPCLHLGLERQCVFPRDFASAPFPLHADRPFPLHADRPDSKTFFFGLAWAECSSAWCSA